MDIDNDVPPPPAKRRAARKPKVSNSRPARWARAVEACQAAQSEVNEAINKLNAAREELAEVQQEYQDWLDNLPESLQQSALGDKLTEVTNLDVSSEVEAVELDWLDEAECIDLPLGFGRD